MTCRQERKGFEVGVAVDVDTAAAAVLVVAAAFAVAVAISYLLCLISDCNYSASTAQADKIPHRLCA